MASEFLRAVQLFGSTEGERRDRSHAPRSTSLTRAQPGASYK